MPDIITTEIVIWTCVSGIPALFAGVIIGVFLREWSYIDELPLEDIDEDSSNDIRLAALYNGLELKR